MKTQLLFLCSTIESTSIPHCPNFFITYPVSNQKSASARILNHSENNEQKIDCNIDQIFDVVLMDFNMPKMDGHTATREMRCLGFKGPIIGITGW